MELIIFIALIVLGVRYYMVSVKNSKAKDFIVTSRMPQKFVGIEEKPKPKQQVRTSQKMDLTAPLADEELATFIISYRTQTVKKNETNTKNTSAGQWILPGIQISIHGFNIGNGFFYYGGKLKATNWQDYESSLLDKSLKVERAHKYDSDATLAYWPSYRSLSPMCRGAYLDWLSSTRDDPKVPIGYVFLYFYGLERRVIVDSIKPDTVGDDEFKAIASEVRRLLSIYTESRSFNIYAYRLLEFMALLRPEQVFIKQEEIVQRNLRLSFSHHVGSLVKAGIPIPPQVAFEWLNFIEFYPRTPARRCKSEFAKLFVCLYGQRYADGLLISPNKTYIKLAYQPASGSLEPIEIKKQDKIPDPLVLQSVANKLIDLANEVSNKLEPYSRYLGRQGNSCDDLEALLLLPEEISDISQNTRIVSLVQWADLMIKQNGGLVSFSQFWSKLTDAVTDKVNKRELDLIQSVLDKTVYAMAPDPRMHHTKPLPDGNIVLFYRGTEGVTEPSAIFVEMRVAIRFGAMVAKIDGIVHEPEVNALQGFIHNKDVLSAAEKSSLQAYLTWRLNSPHSNTSLKKQIDALSGLGKQKISAFMTQVALASGSISSAEIRQLERLYISLGFDKALVAKDIHALTSMRSLEQQSGYALKKSEESLDFKLDHDALLAYDAETKSIQSMLGEIFAESGDEQAESAALDSYEELDNIDGLDIAHYKLLEQLITQERWDRAEFESMCNALNLMPNGALETINEWSFDRFDDAILEEDDDIYLVSELVEQLSNELVKG